MVNVLNFGITSKELNADIGQTILNAIGRNIRVVSEKLLGRFYPLKGKTKRRNSSWVYMKISKPE
jgi:hypothetical protein